MAAKKDSVNAKKYKIRVTTNPEFCGLMPVEFSSHMAKRSFREEEWLSGSGNIKDMKSLKSEKPLRLLNNEGGSLK